METLFDVTDIERSCRTCGHSTRRHGIHQRGTHPLVCLLFACPVPYECGMRQGSRKLDYPCGMAIDGTDVSPRGWVPK